MTTDRNYDNGYNEGGDGYNPYRADRERHEAEQERVRPRDASERRSAAIRDLERLDCTMARESGAYDAERVVALRAEIEQLNMELETEFLAQWPREATINRRERWNAWAKGLAGHRPTLTEVRQAEQTHLDGYTIAGLKQAVGAHNLTPKA